jgi:hypothetical protein
MRYADWFETWHSATLAATFFLISLLRVFSLEHPSDVDRDGLRTTKPRSVSMYIH